MEPVLLIEGHALLRHALKELLARSGFHAVVEVAEPIDAITQALRLAPRLIILDTTWTEISGGLFGKILREIVPESKIILLVDESWRGVHEVTRSNGVDAFLAKETLTKELPPILAQWHDHANRDQVPNWSMV